MPEIFAPFADTVPKKSNPKALLPVPTAAVPLNVIVPLVAPVAQFCEKNKPTIPPPLLLAVLPVMFILPEVVCTPFTVFIWMPCEKLVLPTGTTPVTLILPLPVTMLPLLNDTPWLPPATAAEVPFKVTSPPVVVKTPPAFNEIPGFVVAPLPLAVKFIAVKPVEALVFVIAAEITMNELAVKVSVVFAAQVTAEDTVTDPLFGPAPPAALPLEVSIVTLQAASCVCRSVLRIWLVAVPLTKL